MNIVRIKLAVGTQIAAATKALHHPKLGDEEVHDARKALKRARSGLRLLRPLDEAGYQRENARLRAAARRLSSVRDDKVLLEALGELLEDEKKPARRRLIARLRSTIAKQRTQHWRALRSKSTLRAIQDALRRGARQVEEWPQPKKSADAPEAAARKLYRKSRKALERSRKRPDAERLHEARKQVKHLSQAVAILAGREPPKRAKKMLERADDVADWLGDDHDLAVVEERLERFPSGTGKAKRRLHSHIEKRRARLQKKALKSGGKLFQAASFAAALSWLAR